MVLLLEYNIFVLFPPLVIAHPKQMYSKTVKEKHNKEYICHAF